MILEGLAYSTGVLTLTTRQYEPEEHIREVREEQHNIAITKKQKEVIDEIETQAKQHEQETVQREEKYT